ncbi:MAG: aminotransferase class V-fold PLP-dependent enzyme [Nocardioidaceae bacterium]
MTDIIRELAELQEGDLPTHGGRTLAYVYDSGHPEADEIGRQAVAAFAATNGLDPTAFPSMLAMENDLVGMACSILDAPDTAVGNVTSGGTESCLLAVQTARDGHPSRSPNIVVPATVHAAFLKAAHYFEVQARVVPVRDDFRADPEAMTEAIDRDTVLVVASAPSYAHGVIDPIAEIAAAAAEREVRCHVDACIGGWVLPFAKRLGRVVRPWTFAVPGVTSISLDLHKYGYTPKGASLLLHATPALRKAQYFAYADWPGYTMLNSTMQSTKSGAPLAAAWAVTRHFGLDGYDRLTAELLAGLDAILAGVARIDGMTVVAPPDSSLVALRSDDSCDVFTIADLMSAAGWYVQPQLSFAGLPPSLHLSVCAATAPHVPEFLAALEDAVELARRQGPIQIDPGIADFIGSLDAYSLRDEDFDGLLVAAGMTGGAGLPDKMAEINSLLDLAEPRLREALLVAFLDRLQRPTRPAGW